MSERIPLFSTSSSLRDGGIFTIEKAGASAKAKHTKGPVSLCDLAKEEGLTRLHLVESNFASFFMARKNLKEVKCDLAFGLKIMICDDMEDKSEGSFKNESKVVIFLKDSAGYEPLIQLYTKAATDGFYYVPRLDWKSLRAGWSDHLILALPFYSSFLAKNTLTFASIAPDLPDKPVVLVEYNDLPFDQLLGDVAVRYCSSNSLVPQCASSIYYKNRVDAKKWMVWRCILGRKTWDVPIDGVTSREFCWEAFKEGRT